MPIYGECVGASASAAAMISQLGGSSCELWLESASANLDHDFALWIGAMGPFAATCISRDCDGHCSATFKEPIDDRIVEHFRAEAC
ncbi:hypothetical protein B2G71_02095 [Novosphingobium sp. PC22D]|uniref:hypothetical protein n=1 Tax=Novosphingobium sp. PC22D TaxID=1962403 RepID=UPI000BF1D62A|nr:hypothetical protein [Novosphingobium sp. PC22D]PEQ14408.1 hypothetical protein B2G71_02095 [Novosphingobium sp. PC22D]